jgi:zinc transporter ZupT
MTLGPILLVFGAALLTALATGLGALPLLFAHEHGARWLGVANALAAGVMLGASASLLIEGAKRGSGRLAAGALLGALFVVAGQWWLSRTPSPSLGSLHGADARKALLIVAVMTVHSVAEGVGVGASFGGGRELGVLITVAIAIHNIPEGLAISLVLVPRGARVRTAAWWSVFSSLPQPLLAVPAYVFVAAFAGILPVGLGFAAGAMVLLVARELLPDAWRQAPHRLVLANASLACAAMVGLQLLLFGA